MPVDLVMFAFKRYIVKITLWDLFSSCVIQVHFTCKWICMISPKKLNHRALLIWVEHVSVLKYCPLAEFIHSYRQMSRISENCDLSLCIWVLESLLYPHWVMRTVSVTLLSGWGQKLTLLWGRSITLLYEYEMMRKVQYITLTQGNSLSITYT